MGNDENIEERVGKRLFVSFKRRCKYQGRFSGHAQCHYLPEYKFLNGGYCFQACHKSCCPLGEKIR